jgi:SagB-type dehydrogenase family enzyme
LHNAQRVALAFAKGPYRMEPWESAIAYHNETKHHVQGYARSLGYLDWATQPDPFRRFEGAPLLPLDRTDEDRSPPYCDIYALDRVAPQPACLGTISEFFYLSLAISAWKEYAGSRWALRCNPSSGNLHPTEGYLVIGPVDGLSDTPSVYHYAPREHALELRTCFSLDLWKQLVNGLPPRSFLVGLSSITWREAWKYGERAYRYCQHDMGHALAACSLSGATLGWRVHLINQMSDLGIAKLLGLDRREQFHERETEIPEALLAVMPSWRDRPPTLALSGVPIEKVAAGEWQGRANRLSSAHVTWERIDAVAQACVGQWRPRPPHPRARSFANVGAPSLSTPRHQSPGISSTPSSAGSCLVQTACPGTASVPRSRSTWGSSFIASPGSIQGSIAWSDRPTRKVRCAPR